MKNKDFVVKKIKSLKRIRPSSSWLLNQKSFLLSEISPPSPSSLFNFNVLKIFKPSFAIALATIILITSLATVGIISAAQNSLPGDFLYPVKTALEQTRLTFTPGQENKTKLSIKLATERMDEFTQIVNEPEKKKDTEKTVKSFTVQIINVREGIDKLKEKNAEKAAEVAELIKKQAPIFEETLTKGADQLGYILPGIDEAVEALKRASSSMEFENLNQELPLEEKPQEEE